MKKEDLIQKIEDEKIIVIARGIYGEDCLRLAEALLSGGISLMELAFEADAPESAADMLRKLSESFGASLTLGAGTITDKQLFTLAEQAGADMIISPEVNEELIRETGKAGLVSIPGALTPGEVIKAQRAGADFVKIFPAFLGGPAYFKAIKEPLKNARLLAFGGIRADNIKAYLEAGAAGAGVGAYLVNPEWIAAGEFEKITAAARLIRESL